MKNKILLILIVSALYSISVSCSDSKYVEENKFIGEWELNGRDIYSGMRINIKHENNVLIGRIVKKPDNDYGNLFLNEGDIWVSQIKRSANYYFKITESKIAGKLFALYDLPTSTEYYAIFSEDFSVIFLSTKSPSLIPKSTKVFFKRIE